MASWQHCSWNFLSQRNDHLNTFQLDSKHTLTHTQSTIKKARKESSQWNLLQVNEM